MPPAFPKGLGKRGEAHRDRPGKQGPPHLTRTSEGTKGGGFTPPEEGVSLNPIRRTRPSLQAIRSEGIRRACPSILRGWIRLRSATPSIGVPSSQPFRNR